MLDYNPKIIQVDSIFKMINIHVPSIIRQIKHGLSSSLLLSRTFGVLAFNNKRVFDARVPDLFIFRDAETLKV